MAEINSGRPTAEAFRVVNDPGQARLLSDPKSFSYFEPFIARTKTVKAAAEEVGCNLDTMLYRVKTFLKARLLEVVREEKRAGRPLKHYRSSSDAYFVPFEVTPYAGLEERIFEMRRANEATIVPAIARLLREFGWEGQRFYRDNKGEVWRESALDEGVSRPDLDNPRLPIGRQVFDELHLLDEDARALQRELFRTWERYRAKDSQGSSNHKKYALELAFLKLEP